ncbi:MAG: SLBB domain-containing protein [Candidatus Latescibacteria bacterium]|nr:SLBB domain-containing protein [Candidatus Latescibacterota bacterium]
MHKRFDMFLLSAVVVLMVCSPGVSQTLDELLGRSKKGREEVKGPKITPLGVAEEEEPTIPVGIPVPKVPEEKTAFDKEIDPAEYTIGPGDEFTIYLWGQLDTPQILAVNPEGKLLVPYVGPIAVCGMTLAGAKERIVQRVKERYPNVDVSVELSNLRKFRLFVAGRVGAPGSYTAFATDRAFDVIERAKGLASGASRRNIRIYRRDGEVLTVDLERFLRLGDLKANPHVKMGDVLYIPFRRESVAILGPVNAPGEYEFKPGEGLKELLELAGGLRSDAQLTGVEVIRFEEDGKTRKCITIDLRQILGAKENPGEQFPLQPDDQIFIRPIPQWHLKRLVRIDGEVKYPGLYVIEEGKTTLSQIIEKAGGFTKDALLDKAEVVRWEASRTPDPEFERLKAMAAVQGGLQEMTPQEYEYFKVKSRERRGTMSVDFRKLFVEGDLSEDIVLKHGDFIRIPRKWETVTVSGQVKRPGLLPYEAGKGPGFYIEQAGGYSWNANKRGTRVIKGKTGLWLKPEKIEHLEPGDAIFVPENPRRDWWQLARDTSTILGQLATFIIVARSVAGL